ncbi:MAG: ABC transporter ATP-binding protein [Defluviitaleaceae bacterium]|nr:ABC transporter ATP-binding protein [Defluviitaleaceae bacterium]
MIKVTDLYKRYGEIKAVNGISFSVDEGMLFSFLGVNGAGKSTTINILTTLLEKTCGAVSIGGYDIDRDPEKVRGLIGVVFQEGNLDAKLTVKENITFRCGLYMHGARLKEAVRTALETTGAIEYAHRRYETLSGGQRRKADIARSLVNMPRLLFLDEPTTGLDPKTRRDIWQLIRDLQKTRGMTVFLTTHYMEEAAESDDINIIHQGEIIARGTPAILKETYSHDIIKIELKNGQRIHQQLKHTTEAIPIISQLHDQIAHFEVVSGTMDDVFIKLTGGQEDDAG